MNHSAPVSLVAFGSNLGNRLRTWTAAIKAISGIPRVHQVVNSTAWETDPVGGQSGQSPYVNGAIRLSTSMEAVELFESLAEIEQDLGRQRSGRWLARSIDLDLLIHHGQAGQFANLVLPHPRMSFRRFVLQPCVEIAPAVVHPTTGLALCELLEILDRRENLLAIIATDLRLAQKSADALQADLPDLKIVAQIDGGNSASLDSQWRAWCGTLDPDDVARAASLAKLVVVIDSDRTVADLCQLFSGNNRIAAPSLLLGNDLQHWSDEISAAIAAAAGRAQRFPAQTAPR